MGGLDVGELGDLLVNTRGVHDRAVLATRSGRYDITRISRLLLTGPMVKQRTSAACPWKLCNWVQVTESQNLTIPMESPDTIVPSLVKMHMSVV